MKPKLFIGSSSEARATAYDFAKSLSNEAIPIVWDQAPEFEPTTGTLPSLLSACKAYDFGLFLLTPDDDIQFRGEKGKSARDNVLLELGLFLGALGAQRTFAVTQTDEKGRPCVKTTSDLAGINFPRFSQDADQHARAAGVSNAVHSIKTRIQKLGVRPIDFKHVDWGFSISKKCLYFTIPKEEIIRHESQLSGKLFMIVGRKEIEDKDFSEDNETAKSKPRKISQHLTTEFRIEVKGESVFEGVKVKDRIELCLFMTNSDLDLEEDVSKLTGEELTKHGWIPLLQLSCYPRK